MDLSITELRHATKMTQGEFASFFGIPVGTLRNWEQGIAKPPHYVFSMIYTAIGRDKMINVETIKLIDLMNRFSAIVQSSEDIKPFDQATWENRNNYVFYDQNKPFEKLQGFEDNRYPIVSEMMVDDIHHDIISYYQNSEYKIYVVIDEMGEKYIDIVMNTSETSFVVENGRWYSVFN